MRSSSHRHGSRRVRSKGVRSKLFVCAVAGAVAAAPATAPAGPGTRPRPRQEQQTYVTPAVSAFVAGSGGHVCGNPGTPAERTGCLTFAPGLTERYVRVDAEDASGLPVPLYLDQVDGPIREKDGIFLCGDSEEPVEIAPGLPLTVVIQPARQDPLCAGAATTGSVTITFLTRPRG